jgi:Ethanolamine utilization protein EutJ (predicted chaperonin)
MERRPAIKKISTLQTFGNGIFKEGKLTIGVDLGDRWSPCCVLDEEGEPVPRTSQTEHSNQHVES